MRVRLLLAVLALLSVPAVAGAQILFVAGSTIPVPIQPGGAVVAELTGDAFPDLAVTADTIDRVELYVGDGTGTFGAPIPFFTGPGTGPDRLVAEDLDGDGDLDLAVVFKNLHNVTVLLNNGVGGFTLGSSTATGLEPRYVASGDLDGDGDIDLVTANRDADSVTVLLNGGSATFVATDVAVGAEPRSVGVGDLDGDGDLDLASTDHDDRTVTILTNNGSGGFSLSTTFSVGFNLRPDGIDTADLDDDGDLDLAVSTSDVGMHFISVFTNTGGVFSLPVHFPTTGLNPSDVVAVDFDLDGAVDVATVTTDSNQLAVLPGSGTGTLGPAVLYGVGTNPDSLAAGDLDGDGKIDLVVPNRDSDDVSLFLNVSAGTPPTGDFIRGNLNGDSATDIADAVFGLDNLFVSGPTPTCLDAADVNDDGNFDIADMVYLLGHLFVVGSPDPPAPHPGCGVDPTADSLGCVSFPLCP